LTKIRELLKDIKDLAAFNKTLILSLFFDIKEFIICSIRYVFKSIKANLIEIFKKPESNAERKPKKFFLTLILIVYVFFVHLLIIESIYKGFITAYITNNIYELLYLSQNSILLSSWYTRRGILFLTKFVFGLHINVFLYDYNLINEITNNVEYRIFFIFLIIAFLTLFFLKMNCFFSFFLKLKSKYPSISNDNTSYSYYYVFFKYTSYFFVNLKFLLNYVMLKVYGFLIFIRNYGLLLELMELSKGFKKIIALKNLYWRPVFKKWSYFGLYKSYKSKWLNK